MYIKLMLSNTQRTKIYDIKAEKVKVALYSVKM